jgi:two-component system OmpR family response regulator
MVSLLGREGYAVLGASDGAEALKLVELNRPSLVLLDLMMPGMDGEEVLRWIRAHPDLAQTPVVILSGDVLDDRVDRLRELGANAMLSKPVNFVELFAQVERFSGGAPVVPLQGGLGSAILSGSSGI